MWPHSHKGGFMPGHGGTDRSGKAFCQACIRPKLRSRVRCRPKAKAAGPAVRTALQQLVADPETQARLASMAEMTHEDGEARTTTVPLLERLDGLGMTRRYGDFREWVGQRG